MSVPHETALPATEIHPELELTECPHCGVEEYRTEKRMTVVGKITVGIGAAAVLISLALTFVYIGLILLIPSALILWAGTLIQEDVNVCEDCGHEF
jgi:hypothetical protein